MVQTRMKILKKIENDDEGKRIGREEDDGEKDPLKNNSKCKSKVDNNAKT